MLAKCWQAPTPAAILWVIPARGSVSHSGKFRKCQDHPQQQLQPLRQIPPHPHSPVGLPGAPPSTHCVSPNPYLSNLQWEINCGCFMLTVCTLGWKRGRCGNLIVQIPPWEVQGGFPGENYDLWSDMISQHVWNNIYYQKHYREFTTCSMCKKIDKIAMLLVQIINFYENRSRHPSCK